MDCNHSTIFRRLHPPRPSQWPQAQSVLFTSGWSCPSAFAVPCPDLLQSFQRCSEHGQEVCDVPCRMRVSPRNLVQPVRPKRSMVRNCIRINLSDPTVECCGHSIRRLTPDHSCPLHLVLAPATSVNSDSSSTSRISFPVSSMTPSPSPNPDFALQRLDASAQTWVTQTRRIALIPGVARRLQPRNGLRRSVPARDVANGGHRVVGRVPDVTHAAA